MSIAGGFDLAIGRATSAGCDVLQIFTKNSSQWKARTIEDAEAARFRTALESAGLRHVAGHASYLINLATPDEILYRRSIEALLEEMRRCDALGAGDLILHPGSHVGAGVAHGIARIAAALDEVHAAAPRPRVRVLLEIGAGQGSCIGSRFEDIGEILSRVALPGRLGVCFDTCHAFAAGYDLRGESAYARTFDAFEAAIGIDRIAAFHLNDSRTGLGSRVDRHQHIGRGWLGLEPFRLLLNDARFAAVPKFLETPKGPELKEDIENLAALRALIGERRPRPWTAPAPAQPRAARDRSRRPRPGTTAEARQTARRR